MEEKIEEEKQVVKKKKSATEKCRENPWVVSTFVLGVFALVLIVTSFSGGITGGTISADDAGELALDFFNTQLSQTPGILDSIEGESGLYKVIINIQGEKVPLYFTKDGKWVAQGQGLISMDVLMEQQIDSQQTQQISEYTEEDLKKLAEFSSCLSEKGLKIYGANWCGWTERLVVDTLGGFDIVGEAYVECTEEEELCKKEGVTGYPTIKLNGELYSGERTLEALGEATGCSVPELEGTGVEPSADASC